MIGPYSVGELVEVQFPVFDVDGITPITGLLVGSFVTFLARDGILSALPVGVVEIGASGRYVASFTPDTDGLWYVEIQTPFDDVFGEHVAVGAPAQDVVDAITIGVWSEPLPGAYPAGSAGERLAATDDRVELLTQALVMASLTATAGSTTTVVNATAAQANGYYDGLVLVVRAASGAVARRIDGYVTGGAFTVDPPLPQAPAAGDQVVVLGMLGEVGISESTDLGIKLAEIHRLMGLDPESPLCVAKNHQEAGNIRLKHTAIGSKVLVQRET
jgi:hypothetical protein